MIQLVRLTIDDAEELLLAAERSRNLHGSFVEPPRTLYDMQEYLEVDGITYVRFGVRGPDGQLAAIINLNAIVRGAIQSAFLGFYALAPYQGRGWVRLGLQRVLKEAFGPFRLHRLEANIQPDNQRSIALIKSLGFRLEGHSLRYLRVAGAWRDHDRYALTIEETEHSRAGLQAT